MPATPQQKAQQKQASHFYRYTIALARLGDPAALKIVSDRGWNIYARVGTVRTPLGVATNRDQGVASTNHRAAPRSASPPQPPPPPPPTSTNVRAHARAPRAVRIPKLFAAFLDSRCKDLKLAAKVLGVTPRPPLLKSIVRAAWIALISIHHPDKGGALESAQAINAAYQLLSKFSH